MLTANRVREVLDYDPETGVLTRLITTSTKTKVGAIAGGVHSRGYRDVRVDGRTYKAHRLIWLWMTGEWPPDQIDHKDLNRANNQWANLRAATNGQNLQNRRSARADNSCGLLGVTWHRRVGKWQAQIQVDGRKYHLGYFDSAEEAHAAYLKAKAELHPFSTLTEDPR